MNITFIPLPSTYFAVPAANKIDYYMWVKEAVGHVSNASTLRVRADYIPEKKQTFVAADMAASFASLLPEGVVRLRSASNIAISNPA